MLCLLIEGRQITRSRSIAIRLARGVCESHQAPCTAVLDACGAEDE